MGDDSYAEGAATVEGQLGLWRDGAAGLGGGVCAGLATYLQVSPWLVRLALWLGLLASNAVAPAYVVLWLALPDRAALAATPEPKLPDNARATVAEWRQWAVGALPLLHGRGPGAMLTPRLLAIGGFMLALAVAQWAVRQHWLGPLGTSYVKPLALMLVGTVLIRHSVR